MASLLKRWYTMHVKMITPSDEEHINHGYLPDNLCMATGSNDRTNSRNWQFWLDCPSVVLSRKIWSSVTVLATFSVRLHNSWLHEMMESLQTRSLRYHDCGILHQSKLLSIQKCRILTGLRKSSLGIKKRSSKAICAGAVLTWVHVSLLS
jgi:hypothetical protein